MVYNVNNLFDITSSINAYGANSTVDYYSINYDTITTIDEVFPIINHIHPNDYIIISVTIPDLSLLSTNNVFSISPYFYSYQSPSSTDDAVTVFASTDMTIEFFDKINTSTIGMTYNICITANKIIAKYYRDKNYIISMLPMDLLASCTFTILIRLGNNITQCTHGIDWNQYIHSQYYQCTKQHYDDDGDHGDHDGSHIYYHGNEIIRSFPRALLPKLSQQYFEYLYEYNKLKYFINSHFTLYMYDTYPYLSNIYHTNHSFASIYDAIQVTPPAQLQGNNTGELYFNSDFIDLLPYSNQYLYIISLNQNKMKVSLTSNIQIYDGDTYQPLATYMTSPDIPSFTSPIYPNTDNPSCYPLIFCKKLPIIQLFQGNTTRILIVERMCYSPINYYQPNSNYAGNSVVYIGEDIDIEILMKNVDQKFITSVSVSCNIT